MQIKRLTVDKKPNNCIVCPLIKLRICGEQFTKIARSGAMYYGMKPDKRCMIKEL